MTGSIAESIRDYILTNFNLDEDEPLGMDDDLLELLDSLQVLGLITELESRFSIKLSNAEMTPDNLGSVSALAKFIESKL